MPAVLSSGVSFLHIYKTFFSYMGYFLLLRDNEKWLTPFLHCTSFFSISNYITLMRNSHNRGFHLAPSLAQTFLSFHGCTLVLVIEQYRPSNSIIALAGGRIDSAKDMNEKTCENNV